MWIRLGSEICELRPIDGKIKVVAVFRRLQTENAAEGESYYCNTVGPLSFYTRYSERKQGIV